MVWLTGLADGLRARGLTVVEVEGWKTRGVVNRNPPYQRLDLIDPNGTLWHHTATNRNSFFNNEMPTLGLLANGRSDLPGPLCQIGFGRNGTVFVVAAGVGNHAGRGWEFPGVPEDMGNFYLIGIEMESSGIAPWDWTPDQIRVAPYLGAALMDMYGYTLNIGHMEYSKEGKIDPAGWPGGMDGLRAQITAVSGSAAIAPGPPDSPQIIIDKPKPKDGFLMALTDKQQQDLYNRIIGGVPDGAAIQKDKRRLMDNKDGNAILAAIATVGGKVLTKDDGNHLLNVINGLQAGDAKTVADQIVAAIGPNLAAEVATELGARISGGKA